MSKTTRKTTRVRVGGVQMISSDWDLAGNVNKALRFCDRAAKREVQILCFPECASVGFDWVQQKPVADQVPAEPVPGPLVQQFSQKAAETDMYIIFGMAALDPFSFVLDDIGNEPLPGNSRLDGLFLERPHRYHGPRARTLNISISH